MPRPITAQPALWLAALLALFAAALVAAAPDAAAQPTERVRFARGASGAEVEGTVRGDQNRRYLVGVRRGQTVTVRLTNVGDTDAYAVFEVFAPGRRPGVATAAPSETGERHGLTEWRGRVSRSGDYQVVVRLVGDRPASYALSVQAD